MMKRSMLLVAALAAGVTAGGCSATTSNQTKGAVIGATSGGAIGAMIGNATGSTGTGAVLGALIGGTGGAIIGHQMDQQAKEIKQNIPGAIVERVGSELVDVDYDDVVDAVLLWWREDDGDLVDALVDALSPLASGGVIWLLTPKAGRDGHVEPSDIAEAAPTAGLSQTSSISAGADWNGARLVARGSKR